VEAFYAIVGAEFCFGISHVGVILYFAFSTGENDQI
jgi:hypothetical protein